MSGAMACLKPLPGGRWCQRLTRSRHCPTHGTIPAAGWPETPR